MTTRCTAVHAVAALPALADAVAGAKQGDPLAHVTIIVPTNAAGVTARRWLGAHGGVAAIDLVTPGRLAERLAGASLAASGRRPVSTPLIDIAVREVLARDAGVFTAVADHPSTVTSLRDLHRELRLAGPKALSQLSAASSRGRAVARVSSRVAERLAADWFDEADLLAGAIAAIRAGGALSGQTIAFLPTPTTGLAAELFAAVGELTELHVVAQTTGVAAVDDEMISFLGLVGCDAPTSIGPSPTDAPIDASVVSTTDADEEVRAAVRELVDAARAGVPFARMSVVWPVDQPYARLVEHHLDVAGIAWNGRPGTHATERLVPRFLLDLLGLDRRGLRRTDLFDFLADVPVRGLDGERVSVARWERVARAAGVTRDEHWLPRLTALAHSLRDRDPPRTADADAADALAEFVAALRRDLGRPDQRRRWNEWADWCERQVERRLGRSVLDQLDEAERIASDHTNTVLDRLRSLDAISGPIDRPGFHAAFASEFDVAPGRLGRLGHGVSIGSLSGTIGLTADLTVVVGAADGLLPPVPASDPLISDADRRACGLASADARAHRSHRSFLGHVTTSDRVVVTTPRGDLRATADRLGSRWIAAHLADAAHRDVHSHHAGIVGAEFPSHAAEHRLRTRAIAALRGPDQLLAACSHDDAARRGLAMRSGRRSDRITVFDGDLSGIAIDHLARPMSPSQIEAWPDCPHGYFVRFLLGVYPLDDTADELTLTPIERGNVVHTTLDRFHRLVAAGELAQPDADGWSPAHVEVLLGLYDAVADEFERSGRTGRAAPWHLDRRRVRAELLEWFERDGRTAAERHATVIHSELRFGDTEPVTIPLADGRRLAVRGVVDRIDEIAGGGLVVMDHKTGSDANFTSIDASDPTEGATKFQLPVYAAAALARRGEDPGHSTVTVRAEYDFFQPGSYSRHGYTFDREVWGLVTADLSHVVAGIESGLFPAVAEPPGYLHRIGCHYCRPDGFGADERYAEWVAKRTDPRIVPWFPPEDEQ